MAIIYFYWEVEKQGEKGVDQNPYRELYVGSWTINKEDWAVYSFSSLLLDNRVSEEEKYGMYNRFLSGGEVKYTLLGFVRCFTTTYCRL